MASWSRLETVGAATTATAILGIITVQLATLDRQSIPENPDVVGPTHDPNALMVLLLVFGAVLFATYILQRLPPVFHWWTVDEE